MIPPGLAALLAKPLVKYGVPVLIVVGILLLAYCHGRSAGRNSEVVKQQEREIEVQRDLGQANENAAEYRVEDARKLDAQERELQDATRDAKSIDDARARRGCLILRQQGRDVSHLPACR